MNNTKMDVQANRLESHGETLFAHSEGAARSQYPLVVSLWVLFLSLVLMANPG